jgi:hypothetical protein
MLPFEPYNPAWKDQFNQTGANKVLGSLNASVEPG